MAVLTLNSSSGKNSSSVTVSLGFDGWLWWLPMVMTRRCLDPAPTSGQLNPSNPPYLTLARYLFLLPLSIHLGVKTFMSSST